MIEVSDTWYIGEHASNSNGDPPIRFDKSDLHCQWLTGLYYTFLLVAGYTKQVATHHELLLMTIGILRSDDGRRFIVSAAPVDDFIHLFHIF